MAIIIISSVVSLVVLPLLFITTTMNNSHHNNNDINIFINITQKITRLQHKGKAIINLWKHIN